MSSTVSNVPPRPRRHEPAYLRLHDAGELVERARQAGERLRDCDLCARYCQVDRTRGIRGAVCRTGERAVVDGFAPHHGEEDCLRGRGGSGTIFFSWCNLRCAFCQNWQTAWEGRGREVSDRELAAMMLRLQDAGCHNVNLVTPSHVVAQVLAALSIAADAGLRIPVVYNTGGYDSLEALELLDGVVDVYLVDMKYGGSDHARTYSRVRQYVRWNRAAVREMHRQVGDLELDDQGIARRGLLVRHLVLPGRRAGSTDVLRFLAEEVSSDTWINLMAQYRPAHRAHQHPELDRRPTREEFDEVVATARRLGLTRIDGAARGRRLTRWATADHRNGDSTTAP